MDLEVEVKDIAKALNFKVYDWKKNKNFRKIDGDDLNHPAIFSKPPLTNFLPEKDILINIGLQNYRIFSETFIDILKNKALNDSSRINFEHGNFISIHLRELHASGSNKPLNWVENLDINYYKQSLKEAITYLNNNQIKEKKCLIFKDTFKDPSQSKLLKPLKKVLKQNNFEIFDGDNLCNTSWEVISLMSKSKVVISSNSSFSWWGAYLSKGLKISPILSMESSLCTPDEWVQINDGNINPHIWSKLPVFGKIKFKNEFLLSNNILYKKIKHIFTFYIVPKTFISLIYKYKILKSKNLLS